MVMILNIYEIILKIDDVCCTLQNIDINKLFKILKYFKFYNISIKKYKCKRFDISYTSIELTIRPYNSSDQLIIYRSIEH